MIREDVLSSMSNQYNQLTKSGKKVANYIFDHKVETQYMSITSLAEECSVAEATIFRFCRILGFTGYNDFKLALAKSIGNETAAADLGKVLPQDSILGICQKLYAANVASITETMDFLDEKAVVLAVDLFLKSDHVYCFGQGGSLIMAMEAWGRFITVSSRFLCIQDSHMQAMAASLASPNDVVLFFSYSGATKDMLDVFHALKERECKIVLITHFAKSPGAMLADIVLLCGSKEGPLQSGSIAAKMGQLFLIDILFAEYCRRDSKKSRKNQELTANVLTDKLL